MLPSVQYVPKERQHACKECGGVQILVTNWSESDPIDTGLRIAVILQRLYRDQGQPAGFPWMLAHREAYDRLVEGNSLAPIRSTWREELDEFRQSRGNT